MELTELGSTSNRGWRVNIAFIAAAPRLLQIELNRSIEPKGRSRVADQWCDLRHKRAGFRGSTGFDQRQH
jgi:hypothetical protein